MHGEGCLCSIWWVPLLLMMYASSQQTGYWPQYHKDLSTLVGLFTLSLHISRCLQLWEALMTWQSTLKVKAHKYILRHYPLGGQRSAEENLLNAQALIRGAMFVRDGVDEDICHPMLCITLYLRLFCRVQHGIWHLQLSLDLLLIFFVQDPLHYAVFFLKCSRKRFQSPLCALPQQR